MSLVARSNGHRRPLRCALLSTVASGWFTDLLFVCPRLELFSLPAETLGLEGDHDSYRLPSIEQPDAVLMTVNWYAWLAEDPCAFVEKRHCVMLDEAEVMANPAADDEVTFRLSFGSR